MAAQKRAGEAHARVELDPMELLRFVSSGVTPMNAMCERAGMSELDIWRSTKAVFDYFGFPFDEPPPR